MEGAHLSFVLPAERHDERARDKIHGLDGDEDSVFNDRRVNQEQKRRKTPQRKCGDTHAGGAALLNEVSDLRHVTRNHHARSHGAKYLGGRHGCLPLLAF